jgi:hypothetical protein
LIKSAIPFATPAIPDNSGIDVRFHLHRNFTASITIAAVVNLGPIPIFIIGFPSEPIVYFSQLEK